MRGGSKEVRTFTTPAEAWAFVADAEAVERATALGIMAPSTQTGAHTVAEIVDWYQRTYLKAKKHNGRRAKLDVAKAALGARQLKALTPADVAEWIEDLARSPVTRATPVSKIPRVVTNKDGSPQMRGKATLAQYLTALSAAFDWHATDHGYATGFVNPAREAGRGLRQRRIIAASRKRDRRLRPGEDQALFDAARTYVESGAAVVITRSRRRAFDASLALELARLAPMTAARLVELSPADLVVDALGRVVGLTVDAERGPVTLPRRLGARLEARIAAAPDARLMPVTARHVSGLLNKICRRCDVPAMLWPALATAPIDAEHWQAILAEASREADTYAGQGRQRIELPIEAFYRFAIATGLRAGEIMQLQARDLVRTPVPMAHIAHDPDGGRELKTEDKGDRWVPLLPDALAALDMLPTPASPTSTLFGCSLQAIQDRHTKIRKSIGSDDLHIHDLRHEALSRLGDAGFPITDLQLFSGHTSLKSLERYLQGGTVAAVHKRAMALLAAQQAA